MREYITSILYMTIVASLVHQILPSERYRKLIGIVCGFLLVLLFLKPFLNGGLKQELLKRYEDLTENYQDSFTFGEDSYEQLLSQSKQTELELLIGQITKEDTIKVRIWGRIKEQEYQVSKVQIEGLREKEQYQQVIFETVEALYGEGVMITYR